MTQECTRCVIGGVHTLLFPDGPYIEVAERIRILHRLEWALCLNDAAIVTVRDRQIYRVWLTIDGHPYIGDAEIHFGAPLTTPDGTNPLSCAQTSAVGNALEFAGFGDLRLLLTWLGQDLEPALQAYPSQPPHDVLQGVRVVWLDDTPYVPVAERLYFVHRLGYTLRIERCEVFECRGLWIYRTVISVNGQRYLGDAEIQFDASETTPAARYPISAAQTTAVGNALALAGFGDVRSILERAGQSAETLTVHPTLASADAVLRARQLRAGGTAYESAAGAPASASEHTALTPEQRQALHDLCERLGEAEPDYVHLSRQEAEQLLARLQTQQEELLLVVDQAAEADRSPTGAETDAAPEIVSREALGTLKRAWLEAFQIQGTIPERREQWRAFKLAVCGSAIEDTLLLRSHYEQLQTAIEERRAQNGSATARKERAGVARQ